MVRQKFVQVQAKFFMSFIFEAKTRYKYRNKFLSRIFYCLNDLTFDSHTENLVSLVHRSVRSLDER